MHTRKNIQDRREWIEKCKGKVPDNIINSLERKLLQDEQELNDYEREHPLSLLEIFFGKWE